MIDISLPLFVYDDRAKSDYIIEIVDISYGSVDFILARGISRGITEGLISEPLLISRDNGNVLNSNYDTWIATNDREWMEDIIRSFKVRELSLIEARK